MIRLRSLGDTVLMTPALSAAGALAHRIGVVAEDPFHQVLEGHPDLDRLFVIRRRDGLPGRIEAIRRIREYQSEAVIDLHGGTTAALLAYFSGAPLRVGYASGRNARAYNFKVPESSILWGRSQLHTVEHQISPLLALGATVDAVPPLYVSRSPQAEEEVERSLRKMSLKPGFLLIHPAAAFETKRWPLANFVELACRLAVSGHSVVTTAGPGEEALLQPFRRVGADNLRVFGPGSIHRFTALAARCRAFIGNDTGTTHIAAALKKPVAAVFGSSDSQVWRPWGTESRVLQADLDCIPCPGHQCLHYEEPKCIHSITVDQTFAAVLELL